MNWNDYEAVWKRQKPPIGTNADLRILKQTFEEKRRKTAALLFARDALEAGAGVLVCIALAFAWWKMGRAVWPIVFSIILVLGVTTVFIREHIRAHRKRLGPGASLLAKVEAEIAELQHQRALFRNSGKWYYAPCLLATVIGFFALSRGPGHTKAPPGLLHDVLTNPLTLAWIIGLTTFTGYATWRGWRAQRDAIEKHLEPRLVELEKLRRDILSLE